MQNEESLTPAERELEAALQGLLPAGPAIDRDRLMFRAGEVSARRPQRIWQGATVMFAAAFAISLGVRSAPRQIDRFVYVSDRSPDPGRRGVAPAVAPLPARGGSEGEAEYLRLRDNVLVCGVDVLSVGSARSAAMTEPPPKLERLLDGSTQSSQKWRFFGMEKLISVGERL